MKSIFKIILFLFAVVLIQSCSTRRLVPEGQYLVTKNVVDIQNETNEKTTFTKSDLAAFAGQPTNNQIVGTRFSLWVYYKTIQKTDRKFWKWINEKIGKEPVYYDKTLSNSGADQMERYMRNLGYFNADVTSSAKIKRFKAEVIYAVKPRKPYKIRSYDYEIYDSALAKWVKPLQQQAELREGVNYDAYKLDAERDRITDYLKNNGFYAFSRDFIYFEVDSNLNQLSMNVKLLIDSVKTEKGTQAHKPYFINKVSVFPNFIPAQANMQPTDSVKLELSFGSDHRPYAMYFYAIGDPRIRPQTFGQVVQLRENDPFSLRKLKQTYRGLGNFRIFAITDINFETISPPEADTGLLDVAIKLQRSKVHAYAIEVEGTNSAGDLGLRGSLVYSNKNLFRGAELFRLSLRGGGEAQRVSLVGNNPNLPSEASIFNTYEFGVNANLILPRFLSPIRLRNFVLEYQPKTSFNLGYSGEIRSNYDRYITEATVSYDWMTSNTIQHIFTPFNLNSVMVRPSDSFQQLLDQEINQRIKDQYSNHLIFGLRYSFIFNNQNINKIKNFSYFRANIESSGNVLSLFNGTPLISKQEDYSELLGIRYAQFLRFDFDFRQYFMLSKSNQLVFRALIGFGLPYGNSADMPFERSFYGGGANGMRGWVFRELGPGSYSGTDNVERIGDIQLEGSFEYRFPIAGFFKGALFADVGNIWTKNENSYLPGGRFIFSNFYRELAIDAGFGLRLDFSFFIFRLDAALPLRNPARPIGDRWRVDELKLKDIVWNFGIGYPF
jgi:outer membrane protein assembly factor BamA